MSIECRRLLSDIKMKYDIYIKLNNEYEEFIQKASNLDLFNNDNDDLTMMLLYRHADVEKAKENVFNAINKFKNNWDKIILSEESLDRESIEKIQKSSFINVKLNLIPYSNLFIKEEYKRNLIYRHYGYGLSSLRAYKTKLQNALDQDL